MTVEQRLAEIEELGHASYDDTRWLLSLVRSLLPVVEAAERFVEDLGLAGWDADPRSLRAALEAYRTGE